MPTGDQDPRPFLAATVAPLVEQGAAGGDGAALREAIAWMAGLGLRGVQFSAAFAATRPRDLDRSARRDLAATLARHELLCAGIDLFIPPAHFTDQALVSRAVDAILGAIGLASDLGRVPLTAPIPTEGAREVRAAAAESALRLGVTLLEPISSADARPEPPFLASVDTAAVLAAGGDPVASVAALGRALGGVRVVDLLRSGLRGPILERGESRLDVRALRTALELAEVPAAAAVGAGRLLPVLDARQWMSPREGVAASVARWRAL
ncbi:MAG: hypothetical protein GC172_05730 [Phycisphaera sp.]|nr:hypothetical protein [Phycisphaera sp.]